jgi:hypothetical protein
MVITSVSVDPLPLVQGSTAQIKVSASQAVTLSGTLVDQPLHFFSAADGSQVAFQGIYAMADPGVYPLRIDATLADGSIQSFEQMVPIAASSSPKAWTSPPKPSTPRSPARKTPGCAR